jgi:hypothetical protein
MPRKDPAIAVAINPEDRAIQVEVALPLRPRRHKASPGEGIALAPESPAPSRIPRVTRLMAVAIKFQDMVDRGEVRCYADLARLGYVTRARLTQIMNLLLLAPEIQESLLDYIDPKYSKFAITERNLREVSRTVTWVNQRQLLSQIRPDKPS